MLNHARSRTIPKIQNSKDDLHNYDSDENTAIITKTSKTKVKKKNTSQSIKPRQSNEFDNINPNLSKYTPLKPDQINVKKVLQQSVENLDKFDSELYLRKNSERKPELKNRSETANTSEFQISKEPEFTDQR